MSMLPKFSFTVEDDFLRADLVHGKWSVEGYAEVWVEIMNACREAGKKQILAVFSGDMHGFPTYQDIWRIAAIGVKEWGLLSHRIAMVDLSEVTIGDFIIGAEFGSQMGANARAFRDEQSAVTWLRDG
jgi:hypothetical protein